MRNEGLVAGMILAALLLFDACPGRAQNGPTYKAARLKGTNYPDLNGLWQSINEGNWDVQAHAAQPGPPQFGALFAEPAGAGIVEGNEIPYQPWALAKKKENFQNRFARVKLDDVREGPLAPEARCSLPGVRRATY